MPDPLAMHVLNTGKQADPSLHPAGGQPDWNAISFDVVCSRCRYDLQMLAEPRCPECGLAFAWEDVLAAAKRQSPSLFEHNWHRRPVRSWLVTIVSAMRPRPFWQDVSIHDDIRPGPLWFLLLTSVVLFAPVLYTAIYLLSIAGFLLSHVFYGEPLPPSLFAWSIGAGADNTFHQIGMSFRNMVASLLVSPLAMLLWLVIPLLVLLPMLGLLSGLRRTLARSNLRRIHVLRVVAYIAGPICLLSAGLFVLEPLSLSCPGLSTMQGATLIAFLGLQIAAQVVYLRSGLRYYLQLPRSTWIALATVVTADLCVLLAVVVIELMRLSGWL